MSKTTDGRSIERILARIGEAAYRWTIETDDIEWSADAASVFGLASDEPIGSGKAYAELVDPAGPIARADHVLTAVAGDTGEGVPYQIEYAVRPQGADGPLLWIEDTGRWYADGGSRPTRAEGVVRAINERRAREERLAFLSRYDEDTGLFNRSHLLDLLAEMIGQSQKLRTPSAFLVVAVDNLKLINEAHGMRAADRVLAAVAQRIRGRQRDGDVIGRFSPDKIAILLHNCEETQMAVAAERFIAAVGDDVVSTRDGAVSATISVGGVAIPRHARTRDEAIERAQESLDLARRVGIGRFVSYTASRQRSAERKANAELSRQLIDALAQGRLRLAFQPVIDAKSRETVFHEALLRVVQPDGQVAGAAQIVPLAERLGLARLFDLAVLDLVLGTLHRYPKAVLSVNVAPDTAAGPDWIARLTEGLGGDRSVGRRLIVEITETGAIRNIEEAAKLATKLHKLGVRLAIDDFGAGYTSFRNLRALSVDIVKIDGSFIEHLTENEDDRIFVRHLIGLAGELGIETVAEWVRDEAAAALLIEWGVHRMQGDLFGEAQLYPECA